MIIDSHCHLSDEAFVPDLPAVVARAQAAGVTGVLCIIAADDPAEVARASVVREAWPAAQFAAAIHPNRAGGHDGLGAETATRRAIAAVSAVAIGEIGLDYHYEFSPRALQREVFGVQVQLARELDLPVIIHTREATDDTLDVLREAGQGRVLAVMHCFSGTLDEARRALDDGCFISLSGIVTFPKAGALREVAGFVPADRLLVETDAPYLAPVPHRGKRNEPAWVARTLAVVAEARGMDPARLAEELRDNFHSFVGAAK